MRDFFLRLINSLTILVFFSSCNIYKIKNLYVLEDANSYYLSDFGFPAKEIYFLKANKSKTIKSIINKKIKIYYSNKTQNQKAKLFRIVKNGFHFSTVCGSKTAFLNSLVKIDSVFVLYNKVTKEKKYFKYSETPKEYNKYDIQIFAYYIYKLAPCIIDGKEVESKY